MAGETATAMRVFGILVSNAVAEERFGDAGYLHHLLATQCQEMADQLDKSEWHRQQSAENARLARVYHAYEVVHRCVHEPFSLGQPDALLNAARFVLALLEGQHPPPGLSLFCIYLCIAKQAKALNATSLARQMLDKILSLQIPQKFQESVELLTVVTRGSGSAMRDDEVAALCWRCRRHAPPLAAVRCPHCRHRLAHSLATHEVLPLVELSLAEGISWQEALELIERAPLPEPHQVTEFDADVLAIHHFDEADPFLDKTDEEEDEGAVVCSRGALARLSPACVVLAPPRLYRNMLPELAVMACPHCCNLFYTEDYETQILTKGHCPFCRHPAQTRSATDQHTELNGTTGSTPASPEHW